MCRKKDREVRTGKSDLKTEAATGSALQENVFREFLQNSQENTGASVSFSIKL